MIEGGVIERGDRGGGVIEGVIERGDRGGVL